MAAGGLIVPASPTPFMPPGVIGEGVSRETIRTCGTSYAVGGR
jgi:hypothetical protein